MFNDFSEEDFVLSVNVEKGSQNGKIVCKSPADMVLAKVYELYRNKMTEYMKSVPHITPTPYELNSRHTKIKQQLMRQLKSYAKERTDLIVTTINGNHINGNGIHSNGVNTDGSHNDSAVDRLIERCDNELENIFKQFIKENRLEYKKCQLGFTIGWKCNVNQPNYSYEQFDDRF